MMKKIEILGATNLDDAISELKQASEKSNQICYADFNGKEIYSTDTLDEAYSKVTGHAKAEYDKKCQDQIDEWKKQKEEHKAKIPELTKYWIAEGHKYISSEYWKLWDECIPIRLGDLYQGMELDCTIKLIKILNTSDNIEDTYQSAKAEIESQGHSGMSFGLVKAMIRAFHKNGGIFCNKLSKEF